jgi:hypothetical protein
MGGLAVPKLEILSQKIPVRGCIIQFIRTFSLTGVGVGGGGDCLIHSHKITICQLATTFIELLPGELSYTKILCAIRFVAVASNSE